MQNSVLIALFCYGNLLISHQSMLDQVSILQSVVIVQCCVALDVGYLVLQLKCAIYAHFLDILHAILPCLNDINRSYHKTTGKGAEYHTIKKQYAAENFTLAFTSVHWQFMAVLAELFSIYQKKNGQELLILYGSLYKNLRQLGNTCTNFAHIISHFKFLKHTVSLLVLCFGPLCSILFLIPKNLKLQIRK